MENAVTGARRRSFSGEAETQPPVDLKALHAKIGELKLENDFLEGLFTLVESGLDDRKQAENQDSEYASASGTSRIITQRRNALCGPEHVQYELA